MHAPAPAPVASPSLLLLAAEPIRAALEFVSHAMAPKANGDMGDGHPVLIFPGLAGDGTSVAPLREHCRSLGYAAFDWGRGLNTGPTGDLDEWIEALADDVGRLLGPHRQAATLIGWSLGGLYAREVAKLIAPRVRQVITIGTPFNAAADASNVGWLYRALGGAAPAFDAAFTRRLRTPPPMRTTSIYSRSDGVVAWQTCRHARRSRQVEDVEVVGSHIGLGWNTAVLDAIGQRLTPEPR